MALANTGTGDRDAKEIAPTDNRLGMFLHRAHNPVGK
jgi:hypothetical protein